MRAVYGRPLPPGPVAAADIAADRCSSATPRDCRIRFPAGSCSVALEIVETRHRGFELQIDGAGRTVALLADDDLGLAVHGRHLDLPLECSSVPGRGSLLLR